MISSFFFMKTGLDISGESSSASQQPYKSRSLSACQGNAMGLWADNGQILFACWVADDSHVI